MTDRPILMSTPMALAALDGRKTQTRRLAWRYPGHDRNITEFTKMHIEPKPTVWQKAEAGDLCWVREKHWVVERLGQGGTPHLIYDEEWDGGLPDETKLLRPCGLKFGPHPSIHMFRWASRLTFELSAVRMERLQDILDEDVIAEGAEQVGGGRYWLGAPGLVPRAAPTHAYMDLWCSLYGPDAWARNDEVMVLTGVFHQMNIDAFKEA